MKFDIREFFKNYVEKGKVPLKCDKKSVTTTTDFSSAYHNTN
jgi:hypothetical protein